MDAADDTAGDDELDPSLHNARQQPESYRIAMGFEMMAASDDDLGDDDDEAGGHFTL